MQLSADRKYETLRYLMIAVGMAIAVICAYVIITRTTSIYDEAGYAYEGWAIFTRGWRPFADFHTKTLPGLHYIYGLGQALFDPGLLVGRIEAAIFTLATLILAMLTARRIAGRWTGVLVLGIFALNLQAGVRYFRALAYAPAAFFVMLAVYLLTDEDSPAWKLYAASISATCVTVCRHDLVAITLVLWAYMLIKHRPHLRRGSGPVAAGVGALLAVCAYFWWTAPFQFTHVIFAGHFSPPLETTGGSYGSATKFVSGSFVWHLMMFVRWYAVPLMLLAPAAGHVLWRTYRKEARLREFFGRHEMIGVLLAAAAGNYLLHILGSALFGYNIYYMLDFYIFFPVAVAAASAFMLCLRQGTRPHDRAHLAAFAVVTLLIPLWSHGIPGPLMADDVYPLPRIERGAQAIREHVPRGSSIFTIDDPHHFLAAEREIIPDLAHQLFLYRNTPQTEEARRRHIFNNERIDEWLTGGAEYAVISQGFVNWMLNSGRYKRPRELHDFIFSRLEENYEVIATVQDSYKGPTTIYKYVGDS